MYEVNNGESNKYKREHTAPGAAKNIVYFNIHNINIDMIQSNSPK